MNQINETNQSNQTNETAISRRKVELMPQDMVVRNLPDVDFSCAPNGNAGQASSPYNPKYLLLKMPYRFNRSYQMLVCSSAYVLYDRFPSLDLQRSQP
jgi:hypothetical protein